MGSKISKKTTTATGKGLKVDRYFTKDGVNVFDLFKYEKRSSVIRNPSGDAVFEMNNVEVPAAWSQVATDILAQKYFRKAMVPQADGTTGSENSIKQVAHRMANCWKDWGSRYGYFASQKDADIFYDEIVYTITGQLAAPNSPQWFNTGLHTSYGITGKPQGHYFVDPITEKLSKSTSAYERPQPHACFILSVDDDLVNEGGIMDLWVREARIFKYGSGVGTNFSKIRGESEKLSGGGYSSGLMSFLKIGDRAAGAIKSGGTTRRAAKMVCLDLDHPEIEGFVNWKVEEEKKVAALIAAGYSSDYEGEAYRTVSGQNSNNSVRIPNSFFNALKEGKNWDLTSRMTGKPIKSISSQKLWDDIAFAAWACADPGVQYDSTINEWHTCPEGGRINASNPCSEYMFLDNTACNLASINLAHYFDPKTRVFDVKGFEHSCRIWTIVLEISVLMAQFPSKEVAQLSYDYRTLGLGYANLGSALMVNGIPYDSDKARAIGGAITAIMTGTAYATSAEMARELGVFSEYKNNKQHMLRVMRNHRYAAYNSTENYEGLEILPPGIDQKQCPDYLLSAACNAWDKAVEMGEQYGYRNAQTTVIAPTGTIGLVMDCDTTGIEPDFALVKFKKLSGGGYFKIINQAVPEALSNLGYQDHEVTAIVNYAKGAATLAGAPHINVDTLKAKGFTQDELEKLDKGLVSAFEISFAFNIWSLGEECLKRLGITAEQYNAPDFNVLRTLGFSRKQINEANEYICGTMTLEGAPYLKEEHYPIFDCANKCGAKGERYIHAHGHIKMMAAAQPFLSGAISKTINLPNEAKVDEIKDCYELSWALGLKANALYRDGCKLSQPLSTKSNTKEEAEEKLETVEEVLGEAANVKLSDLTPEQVLEAAMAIMERSKDTSFMRQLSRVVQKKSLPYKRRGFTQKATIDGQTVFVRTGEYEDGTLGEIFVDMHKEGATFRSLMNCFAIAVSVGLQYGVPLEEYVEKFTFTRFEPAGMVMGHPNIKSSTSIIDFIFRLLGYEYQNRTDLVHVLTEQNAVTGNPQMQDSDVNPDETNVYAPVKSDSSVTKKQAMTVDLSMGVQSDAPSCNVCGHTTIRSGTCYKCLNCGNSMGCS
ncbi:vitamin B12-dependent ribonucleotide reductase [Mucilaginibacter sp. E4BP6]|uniref:vitamin B12-dependent ribonucleotide reductase n=1 Tax=Mucilaginibacter sp. E4BP6 TaxID=2723089 RepID=UPI0015CAC3CA|nr:vitamin B12-dependent ribonucleotide reductase [Mucilaginibacter sp. E4BP6]NYE68039.1 ribonucleoside-diphosphate reductase alpha chain [Mucilaginibacter sp. E4BP6]